MLCLVIMFLVVLYGVYAFPLVCCLFWCCGVFLLGLSYFSGCCGSGGECMHSGLGRGFGLGFGLGFGPHLSFYLWFCVTILCVCFFFFLVVVSLC